MKIMLIMNLVVDLIAMVPISCRPIDHDKFCIMNDLARWTYYLVVHDS